MDDGWMLMETSPGDERGPFVSRFESIGRKLPEHRVTSAEAMAST